MTSLIWICVGAALTLGGLAVWRHTHSPTAQAVRRLTRQARIVELERGVGMSVSYPDAQLPTLQVVRNPAGEWGMANRWVIRGTPGIDDIFLGSGTKRGAIANAKAYLKARAQAEVEGPTEVRL